MGCQRPSYGFILLTNPGLPLFSSIPLGGVRALGCLRCRQYTLGGRNALM